LKAGQQISLHTFVDTNSSSEYFHFGPVDLKNVKDKIKTQSLFLDILCFSIINKEGENLRKQFLSACVV